ncbi:MAG: hypothetical protein K0R39_1741 [Symbiobacteriaceae bacterium]|nr:hypothetical protein [Symbiobacteriaceae bacterium]
MTQQRPWTFVLSEYLDLPFLLRSSGRDVVAVRSAREALEYLLVCCPRFIVIDTDTHEATAVIDFVRIHCPESEIEYHDSVINQLLAS